MESRAYRFVDTQKAHNRDPRPYNQPNLHTNRKVPMVFRRVRILLTEERLKNKLYDQVWREAEKSYYYKFQTLGPIYFHSNIATECYIAVIAYTMGLVNVSMDGENYQLYEDFNRKFRELKDESSWECFPYKSFYYLLKCARHGIANQSNPKGRLYRGIRDVHMSPKPKIGDSFYFHCFSSCSQDFGTAKGFMRNNGTMIVLEDGAKLAMNIAPYSSFDDYEVLVFPHNEFKVVSFEQQNNIDVIKIKRAEWNIESGGLELCKQLGQLAITPQPFASVSVYPPVPCSSVSSPSPIYPTYTSKYMLVNLYGYERWCHGQVWWCPYGQTWWCQYGKLSWCPYRHVWWCYSSV